MRLASIPDHYDDGGLHLLKTSSAAENLVASQTKCGPKKDRNLNSQFNRENSLFCENNSLLRQKNPPSVA
jgi:hypothetical protein